MVSHGTPDMRQRDAEGVLQACGFSSGGQLPVPPALDLLRGAAHALLLCLIEAIIAPPRKKSKEKSVGPGNDISGPADLAAYG